ncbi:4-hydroxy-3-methylbut-2-enyl diphosphate reductase [Pseudodesulfovibrio tunisiensis]|uniref:4-hydroxy-3-methylbut-2-enyl diphosphate reductase n=1 Tax=Pseudodesulfovibrio tunisiensis TaxID=463192 RepID=UPI001FB25251|nr:4-hydroxy-3-methylbut-2-enyl diphosphate reductase [Pseudodesulfovibrio tunisiensis]
MKVILAETAGFCMGVALALRKLDNLIAEAGNRPIYTLGPIIHNPQVLEHYARRGVTTAKEPEVIPNGSLAVIRAHGITRDVEETLRSRDVLVKDATCPRVKKAQLLIERHTADGAHLLLYGEADHPEVKGLVSYAGSGFTVFDDPAELDMDEIRSDRKYVLAAQTTQDRHVFEELAEKLDNTPDADVTILRTICDATRLRQREARDLASNVGCMVVVGGRNSGNTRRLVQVAAEQGAMCRHVEVWDEIDPEDFRNCSEVGVTAGASTPKSSIDAVVQGLKAL